jgi:hypothetical protein
MVKATIKSGRIRWMKPSDDTLKSQAKQLWELAA